MSTTTRAAALAAVCAVAYFYLPATPAGDGTVIDGLAFPASVRMGGVTQALTGGGTRSKYGAIKVYAVALYVDSAGGSSALKRFAGPKPPKDAKFFAALVDGTFARTLALIFHRSVSSEAMVNALDEAMAKRLPSTTVAKFRAALLKALGEGAIPKGGAVYLMCRGTTLAIGSGTPSASATLKEKGVCPALFDVYYGKQPVSPAAKEGAATGFASRGFYA